MSLYRRFVHYCATTNFVQQALAADIDLGCMARRPAAREKFGIFLILLSYVIGWPAVAVCALAAMRLKEPLVLVVGGPVMYGVSHLVFIAGAWLAGKDYARVFLTWSVKKVFEKALGCGAHNVHNG